MATIQEKKLYLVTLSFFKIYDRPTGKYVSLPPLLHVSSSISASARIHCDWMLFKMPGIVN